MFFMRFGYSCDFFLSLFQGRQKATQTCRKYTGIFVQISVLHAVTIQVYGGKNHTAPLQTRTGPFSKMHRNHTAYM